MGGGSLVPVLPLIPCSCSLTQGKGLVILSGPLASNQETGMAESRTGNGVGKQDQSRVQQRVAQAGEERVGPGRKGARRGLQKIGLEV